MLRNLKHKFCHLLTLDLFLNNYFGQRNHEEKPATWVSFKPQHNIQVTYGRNEMVRNDGQKKRVSPEQKRIQETDIDVNENASI